MSKINQWTDDHFHSVVAPLALLGCIVVSVSGAPPWFDVILFLTFRGSGSLGCYFWAVHLRKKSPGTWLLLGIIPLLPQCYLLGWHRANKRLAETELLPFVDCPRCGTLLEKGASECRNCSWVRV